MRRLALLSLLLALSGCGPEQPDPVGSGGLLELLEPPSPVGLHYGERTLLRVRYRYRGEPRAGVRLTVDSAGPLGGATLSAGRLVTDGRGEAQVLLQAGAAEIAFRVLVSGPDAQDLEVDVAVSARAFGSVAVLLDRRGLGRAVEVAAMRASLLIDTRCADLRPAPQPPPALRSLRSPLKEGQDAAALPFGTLLLRGYTAVGRAEDSAGRLLAWGCVELPEGALVSTPEAEVPLPLVDVYPRPAGSYTLSAQLGLDPLGALWSAWGGLACGLGAGQALLDATLAALPPREMPLASRLQAKRGPAAADRCRPPRRGTEDTADLRLDGILAAPGLPGEALGAVARDLRAIQQTCALRSRLLVRGEGPAGLVADHTLLSAELDTATASATYDLLGLGLPVLSARDLLLPAVGRRIDLPTHAFTLRLPLLWRRALAEVVLRPRGLTAVDRLLSDSVAAARHGGKTGCAAVESLLCEIAGPPCAGVLLPACQDGRAALQGALDAALRDGAPDLDLSLAGFALAADPDGTLVAASLEGGQLQGMVQLGTGLADASGPLSGTRP